MSVVRSLDRADGPDEPGMQLWRLRGELQYVGKATILRSRLWGSRRGETLGGLSLGRNLAELFLEISPRGTEKAERVPAAVVQAAATSDSLLSCEVSWRV